ncbi:hypothetical protein IWX90DRAFT_490758 [Phyllosticta citrichinensis]|uniref:Uncharacterized protein n=1 Tax=Phyllosticta citrichinensis TaxID=1130410 RepID=A0ABR1XF76_9PEZI
MSRSRSRNAPGDLEVQPLQLNLGNSTLGQQWIAPTNLAMLSPESFMIYNNLAFLASRQDEMAKTLNIIASYLISPAARSAATTASTQAARREKLQRYKVMTSDRFRPTVESLVVAWEGIGKKFMWQNRGSKPTERSKEFCDFYVARLKDEGVASEDNAALVAVMESVEESSHSKFYMFIAKTYRFKSNIRNDQDTLALPKFTEFFAQEGWPHLAVDQLQAFRQDYKRDPMAEDFRAAYISALGADRQDDDDDTQDHPSINFI